MFQRIRQMLIKEFLQVLRDPRMRIITFVTPCIQTLIIGYAVTTDVKDVRTAVYDLDNSLESRELVARFTHCRDARGEPYFRVVSRIHDESQIRDLLDRGDATLVLRMNHGFGADVRAGRSGRFQIIVDGSDSNTAGIVLSYAAQIGGGYSAEILADRYARAQGAVALPGQIDLQARAWFNENLESRNFYVPGVIVIVVTLVTLLLTSMAVVREKEIGTIEQIMVTPIRPIEFVLGKTAPFAVIGIIDVIVVTLVGVYWFEVPVRGSLLLLMAGSSLYLLTTLSAGLLISTISHTQQQAMMATFFFFFPAMLLSGFAFPIANMPRAVQWLTLFDPLRYFLLIIRGIFLRGIGAAILWPDMLALGTMGLVTLWVVSLRFHKTL
jgi:ABC-2 type transport system permease protein